MKLDELTTRGPAFVNNSRETFTPTVSGAISTCLWEVARCWRGESAPLVVTSGAPVAPYDWPNTTIIDRGQPRTGAILKAQRVARRVTGWAHVHQHMYAQRALEVLRADCPATVLCNNDPEVALYLSRHLPEVHVVHWFHNLQLASDAWRRQYMRDKSITTIAVSDYLARAVEMAYQLVPRSVGTVHPGVDLAAFSSPANGLPRSARPPTIVIGFLGRVCVEKAPDVLLRSCLLLAEHRTDFSVQIIGDTNWGFSVANPYRLEVDELVERLEQAGISVARPGHIPRIDLPLALSQSDVHVVPSRWDEPYGLTIVEGMAAGLPIVATAAGGMPELVLGVGELFPRDNVVELANVLDKLLDDPARRAEMGAASKVKAEARTWASTRDGIAEALEHNATVSRP